MNKKLFALLVCTTLAVHGAENKKTSPKSTAKTLATIAVSAITASTTQPSLASTAPAPVKPTASKASSTSSAVRYVECNACSLYHIEGNKCTNVWCKTNPPPPFKCFRCGSSFCSGLIAGSSQCHTSYWRAVLPH